MLDEKLNDAARRSSKYFGEYEIVIGGDDDDDDYGEYVVLFTEVILIFAPNSETGRSLVSLAVISNPIPKWLSRPRRTLDWTRARSLNISSVTSVGNN